MCKQKQLHSPDVETIRFIEFIRLLVLYCLKYMQAYNQQIPHLKLCVDTPRYASDVAVTSLVAKLKLKYMAFFILQIL